MHTLGFEIRGKELDSSFHFNKVALFLLLLKIVACTQHTHTLHILDENRIGRKRMRLHIFVCGSNPFNPQLSYLSVMLQAHKLQFASCLPWWHII